MGVRSLKDLDKIQEKGSILLSARRARSLVLGASCLVVAAFLVGLQVGRSLAPVEGKVVAQDVASADRTIEEILAAYRAEGRRPETAPVPEVAPPAESATESATESVTEAVTEAVEEATVAEVAVQTEPRIVLPPPIPEVPVVAVVPEVVVAEVITPAPAEPEVIDPLAGLPGPRTSGGYAVQLAAFPSAEEAAALVGVVEAAGARVYTMEVEVRGETWHRVRVGRFAGRSEAQAWIPMLTELTPFEPIVVTE